eukprot:TRINITY_DN6293_c0_g1_i4.p1 TRINITY_DN6293_c0_g1~~TRINITY_DN6293_c0_g1_i4.p1  ORF type:complete len:154 (-),score=14.50 TRINITY_DN6293_c0_g1_i4:38-499(-)
MANSSFFSSFFSSTTSFSSSFVSSGSSSFGLFAAYVQHSPYNSIDGFRNSLDVFFDLVGEAENIEDIVVEYDRDEDKRVEDDKEHSPTLGALEQPNAPPALESACRLPLPGTSAKCWMFPCTQERTLCRRRPMYSALIPVSYTHLTLPTNREV